MSARRQLYVCSSCCVVRAIDRALPSVNGTRMTSTGAVLCDSLVNGFGKVCTGTLIPLTLGQFLTAAERAEAEQASEGGS